MIDFEFPAAFFLLLFIPLLIIFRKLKLFSRIGLFLTLSDWNGESFKWKTGSQKFFSFVLGFLTSCFYISLVIALANPVKHQQVKKFISRGADIIFVLDISPSMASLDIGSKNRLDSALESIKNLAEEVPGASLGLVEMAKNAALIVPPTMDRNLFYSRLNSIRVGELGDGSAIGNGLVSAVYHLQKSNAPKKSIVLITDGENNAGEIHPFTAARLSKENNISLYVLGIGTKGTVPLEYVDPKSGRVYSGYLESNYDSNALYKIAQEGGGKYFEADCLAALTQALNVVSKNENVVQSYYIKNNDTFYYSYFLLLASVFILLAWLLKRIVLKEVL